MVALFFDYLEKKVYFSKYNMFMTFSNIFQIFGFCHFSIAKRKKQWDFLKFENAVNMQISLQMLQHKSGGALNSMKGDPWY